MEVVEGHNLDALRRAEPHPPLEQIVRWTIEIAEALDTAHRRGVVHRDIKPANILIGTDGRARITDFGIARVAESDLTRDGAFLGSPSFASPEQLRGAKIDGRADLFSLASVLYFLSTRRRPFEGDDIAAIVYAACHVDPARPSSRNPEIGPAVDAVILRALEKNPDARFQTGRDFANALRDTITDPIPSRTVVENPVERTRPDQQALPSPSAEERAASIASTAAVSIVKASRAAAEEARRLASAFMEWLRRSASHARRGIAALSARVQEASPTVRDRLFRFADALSPHRAGRSRWRLAAAVIVVAGLAIVAGRLWTGGDETPRHGHVWEQLREIVGSRSSRVNVVVAHGLEDGTIELSEEGAVLLSDSLKAPKKELFGASFLSYRSGTDTSRFRLAPGSHVLTVKVTGADGLEIVKPLNVRVDPRSEYDLQISVSTWPRTRISADWEIVEE
jgi:hypothetical protein